MKRKHILILLSTLLLISLLASCAPNQSSQQSGSNPPLVVGYLPFSEKFSPFYSDSAYDVDVVNMVNVSLLTTDREGAIIYNAIDGETREFNGTNYTYYGMSNIDVNIDNDKKETTYTIKIRDDVTFSDGVPLTADDVIFNMYVLCDPSYTGSSTLYSVPIVGIKEYRENKDVKTISGIKKLDSYTLSVTTQGFDASAIYKIAGITIAPLHYYADRDAYNYENSNFGFTKGDLSRIAEKTTKPLGAGPYVFDRYENKVVYFTANENYYKGTPITKFVQFKETDEADAIAGIDTGTIDISTPSGSLSALEEIRSYNKNGELNGDTIQMSSVDNLGYGYIGINASTVKVGDDKGSEESKNLRRGFATLFSVYRGITIGSYYAEAAEIIEYPISSTSWAAPKPTDIGYEPSYSRSIDGEYLYQNAQTNEERYSTALNASIEYFKAAGYTYDESLGKFTAAPKGAKLSYQVIIPAQGSGNHPTFALLEYVRTALAKIGFTLTIYDPSDPNELWDILDTGEQEMWVAAWSASLDPDMYQIAHSDNIIGRGGTNSNHYSIEDKDLDTLIMEARQVADIPFRKSAYKACLDIILDWAVEVPVYQRQNCVIFSNERIDMTTVTPDITTYWGWMEEIETLKMK